MTARLTTAMLGLLTILAYLARPWSCMAVLQLEVTPPGDPYHSVDPHGFGVLGAIWMALLLMAPVLWLLLQTRPPGTVSTPLAGRVIAIMLAIATPMLLQLSYLTAPLKWCWPVLAVSAIWAAIVLTLCLRTAPGSLSAHGAFDRYPRTAWTLVTLIGLGKVVLFMVAMV